MNFLKHLIWVIGLILITIIICGTILYLQNHEWVITLKTEMDNNTLEAVKNINWSALPK